ncbi:MAG TPA: CoA ester lyase [Pseudonocardia sp.]|nr:CoA ester lyase [Pseudonocardia sp.]
MSSLLRRSELATPASNEKMFAKAAASQADLVFLDLEDACAPAQREPSRPKVVTALTELDWGHTVRAVRVNGVDTQWCHGDIIEVVTGAREHLDTIIVPKARTARDVWWVSVLLDQLETKLGMTKKIRLEALIEDVEGLANAEEIARSTDRLDALIFGAGDFSVSQGARVDTNFVPTGEYPGDFWHYARAKIVVAARIAGIAAIDAPYPDYQDGTGYERDARRAAMMGYTGKWCIHPSQITIANEVYAPTPDEVALAERNVKAWHEGEARGLGAVGVEGVLVDAAHLKLAENTLSRARLIAGVSGPVTSEENA